MTDLDTLLIADEDARARLEAVRAAHVARREQAQAEYDARRHAETDALTANLDAEIVRIGAEADAEIARREKARSQRMADVRERAEALVDTAAAVWVRIVEEGPAP